MSFDVTITGAKIRAARFAASFEPSIGPAGYERTRKEPPFLSDKSSRLLEEFSALVPAKLRDAYRNAVMARLSGAAAYAAVNAACLSAASGIIGVDMLRAVGLAPKEEPRRPSIGTPSLG
jgi:hypothetical protein